MTERNKTTKSLEEKIKCETDEENKGGKVCEAYNENDAILRGYRTSRKKINKKIKHEQRKGFRGRCLRVIFNINVI